MDGMPTAHLSQLQNAHLILSSASSLEHGLTSGHYGEMEGVGENMGIQMENNT